MKSLLFEHKTFPDPSYFKGVSGFFVADYNNKDCAPVISTEEAFAQDREALPENRMEMARVKREWPDSWLAFTDVKPKYNNSSQPCPHAEKSTAIQSSKQLDAERLNAFMLKYANTLVYRWRKLNRNINLLMCDVHGFLKIDVRVKDFQRSFYENALPNHKVAPYQKLEQ